MNMDNISNRRAYIMEQSNLWLPLAEYIELRQNHNKFIDLDRMKVIRGKFFHATSTDSIYSSMESTMGMIFESLRKEGTNSEFHKHRDLLYSFYKRFTEGDELSLGEAKTFYWKFIFIERDMRELSGRRIQGLISFIKKLDAFKISVNDNAYIAWRTKTTHHFTCTCSKCVNRELIEILDIK